MFRLVRAFLGAAALACATTGSTAQTETWRTYVNPRFGVRALVPSNWRMGPAPANNDGRSFRSPDGRAEITISGIFNISDTIKEEMDMRANPEGATVTYQKRGDHMIVVSGIKADRIFYSKSILTCHNTVWNDLWIEYPLSDKTKYDALVTRVAASLRGGPGYGQDCK